MKYIKPSYGYGLNDVPINKPIYGFAYKINDDTEDRRLNRKPVLGVILANLGCQYGRNGIFYEYKNGSHEIKKSGSVHLNSRWYADTYDEAVEMYNELVQQRIDNLKRMIDSAEKDKIS